MNAGEAAGLGWGNAFLPRFPTVVIDGGALQQRYWIWAGHTLLAALLGMTLLLRKGPEADGSLDHLECEQ